MIILHEPRRPSPARPQHNSSVHFPQGRRQQIHFPVGPYRDPDAIAGPRALKLMEAAGLLKLKPERVPSVAGILENPLDLELLEIDELQMSARGYDADLMVMGTSCAVEAGFVPRRDALFLEAADSPFAAPGSQL